MSRRALRDAPGAVRRLAAALRPSPANDIAAALGRLLIAIEAGEVTTTAAAAALRRHGESLGKAGGPAAMRAALETVCTASPDRADARRAMIATAWSDLPEWTPAASSRSEGITTNG